MYNNTIRVKLVLVGLFAEAIPDWFPTQKQ